MSPENERKNGGLIALTVEEGEKILEWARQLDIVDRWKDEDQPLWDRLFVWVVRHTPEDAS